MWTSNPPDGVTPETASNLDSCPDACLMEQIQLADDTPQTRRLRQQLNALRQQFS